MTGRFSFYINKKIPSFDLFRNKINKTPDNQRAIMQVTKP